MSYGWLTRDPSPHDTINGFRIDRAKFPTRFEEYKFALETLATVPTGVLVDAGAGFNPEIHNFAYMAESQGWTVLATDANPESLQMPSAPKLTRWLEDIVTGVYTRGLEADAYCCISTLEHLQPTQQVVMMETIAETVRPGGIVVLTADFMAPRRLAALLRYGGFEVGEVEALHGEYLVPRVAWAVAHKPEALRE